MGGQFRVICNGEKAEAFEIVFSNQPVEFSPIITHHPDSQVKTMITGRDTLLSFVKINLLNAIYYLKCHFDIELKKDFEAIYEPESDEERDKIKITGLASSLATDPLSLTYDFITRALIVGETTKPPSFEATLFSAARDARAEERFIDSFRYSFLLMESQYGEGKFKSKQLKSVLKSNHEFVSMIDLAIKERFVPKNNLASDTEQLLSRHPTAGEVIDHIVDKRGIYFHGSMDRKGAWNPAKQESAECLCLFTLHIAMQIAHSATKPMYEDAPSKLHFTYAKQANAIMTLKIDYVYQDPGENDDKNGVLKISMPGTQATLRSSNYAAKQFLNYFEERLPGSLLKSAICHVKASDEVLFEINFPSHFRPKS